MSWSTSKSGLDTAAACAKTFGLVRKFVNVRCPKICYLDNCIFIMKNKTYKKLEQMDDFGCQDGWFWYLHFETIKGCALKIYSYITHILFFKRRYDIGANSIYSKNSIFPTMMSATCRNGGMDNLTNYNIYN